MNQHAEAMEEMNGIRRKLRSEKGASITFALLLFLVCAVLSGVIIVAATAASGRLDQIADSDQRYYAVTSAAELLKDALDGKTVTVKTEETSTEIVPHNHTLDESEPTVTKETKMWYDGNEENPITMDEDFAKNLPSILADAAYRVAEKQYQNEDSEKHLIDPPDGSAEIIAPSTEDIPLNLTTDVAEIIDAVSVDMYVEINDNGIIYFYVSKGEEGKAYTLRLAFKADVKTTVDENSSVSSPMNVINKEGIIQYDTEEKTVKTTETTMTWSLTDIVKATMPTSV